MRIALLCERLHCLPNEGGLLQQNYSDLRKMEKVFQAVDHYKSVEMEKERSRQRLQEKVIQVESEDESERTPTNR